MTNNIEKAKELVKEKIAKKKHAELIDGLSAIKQSLQNENIALLEKAEEIKKEVVAEIASTKSKSVIVDNFPEPKSFPQLIKTEVTNFPKPIDIKIPKVEIPDKIEVKKPKWWKAFDDKPVIKQITKAALAVSNIFEEVFNKAQDPKTPVAVRLSDGEEFYKAQFESWGGGGSSTITESVPTSLGSGQKAVAAAGTQVSLVAVVTDCKSVTVKAKTTNTGFIYVGASSVSSSDGFILSAGDTVSLDINDVSKVYIDASVNNEGVSFLYVN